MTQYFQDITVYLGHCFTFDINFGLIAASRLVCSWIRLLRTSQHFLIQHSTSLLHLQSVGLSRFLHLTCKFSLFYIIFFLPLFKPFLSNLFHFISLFPFHLPLLDYVISIKNLCRYSEMMKILFFLHFQMQFSLSIHCDSAYST